MPAKKDLKGKRIGIRATERMISQLTELQRLLGVRMGCPVSQSQAVAYAIDLSLEQAAANHSQARLI